MKSFQALRSSAIPLTSFHDLLVLLISSSIDLHHILFGLPLLLYPWGFQSNSVFSIAPVSLRDVCQIQFHFLLFIWLSIDFSWVTLHNSSFVILSVHLYSLFVLSIYFQISVVFLLSGSSVLTLSECLSFSWRRVNLCRTRGLVHCVIFSALLLTCFIMKLKVFLCLIKHHTVETRGRITPRIFILSTGWRWFVSFTLWPFYLVNSLR